jgi:hypothetical protein
MSKFRRLTLLSLTALLGACGGASQDDESAGAPRESLELAEEDLVGGQPESRFPAVGYLSSSAELSKALCGATLIAPNVVVTAAHCIYRNRALSLSFGVGQLGEKSYALTNIVYHPSVHLEKQGAFDPIHALLKYDLAYAVLDRSVEGVEPMIIDEQRPVLGADLNLLGYGPTPNGDLVRKGLLGYAILNLKLGQDTIVEIKPKRGGAICHAHGDEGHPAIRIDESGRPMLSALYVGSVTQGFTDCRKYLQFLNGYEASFGHQAFFAEALKAGAEAR